MVQFQDDAPYFGDGGWHVKRTVVDNRAVYGVCSCEEQNTLCIYEEPGTDTFGSVGLLLTGSPVDGRSVPLPPDGVSVSIHDGYWGSYEGDNDVAVDKYYLMPFADGGAHLVFRGDAAALLKVRIATALSKVGSETQVRVNVIKSGPIDKSRYAFFSFDGFKLAWNAMQACSDVTSGLLGVEF